MFCIAAILKRQKCIQKNTAGAILFRNQFDFYRSRGIFFYVAFYFHIDAFWSAFYSVVALVDRSKKEDTKRGTKA